MTQSAYDISFAPPVAIKDGPHRILDTFDAPGDLEEFAFSELGESVSVGSQIEYAAFELIDCEN